MGSPARLGEFLLIGAVLRLFWFCIVYFQDLLTRHKLLSAEFLEQYYDRVSPQMSETLCFSMNGRTHSEVERL